MAWDTSSLALISPLIVELHIQTKKSRSIDRDSFFFMTQLINHWLQEQPERQDLLQ